MQTITSIIALATTLFIALLLIMTYTGSPQREPALIRFRWLLLWIIGWLVTNLLVHVAGHPSLVLLALRGTFVTSILMVAALYQFCRIFPAHAPDGQGNRVESILARSATIVVAVLSLSPWLVRSYQQTGTLIAAQYGWGYAVYLLYLLGALTCIVALAVRQYRRSSRLQQRQSHWLLAGVLLSMVTIVLLEVVLPLVRQNTHTSNYGAVGIVFFVIGTYGALARQQVFNIKVLLAELWAMLLLVVMVVWFGLHVSLGNLLLCLVVVSICLLFIQSVRAEAGKALLLEQANRQLARDKDKLVAVDKLKDDFISMASHELNTPISAIKGYLSMILVEGVGGDIPKQVRGYLDIVFQSSQRLASMVNDLLNVSRIESNRIHLIWEKKAIEAVIRQAVTEVASKAREARHILLFREPKPPMPLTWFDSARITEVLINILGNAIKYTPTGGRILVRVAREQDSIVVSVADNGKGIPKALADRVFQKFSQVDIAKDEHRGTGLGMYIAKKFIELHHGNIWFSSAEEGRGTTFFFSLPLVKTKPLDPHGGEASVLPA